MRASSQGEPAWLLVLVGWMFASCWTAGPGAGARSGEVAQAGQAPGAGRSPAGAGPALEDWNARELRLLPGVGRARAIALVRARWAARFPLAQRREPGRTGLARRRTDLAEGESLYLTDVHGLGAGTARRVAEWLAARGERAHCSVARAARPDLRDPIELLCRHGRGPPTRPAGSGSEPGSVDSRFSLPRGIR